MIYYDICNYVWTNRIKYNENAFSYVKLTDKLVFEARKMWTTILEVSGQLKAPNTVRTASYKSWDWHVTYPGGEDTFDIEESYGNMKMLTF